MSEVHFLDIPIYRQRIEKLVGEIDKEKLKYADIEDKATYCDVVNTFWYPWKYNEIVGWIELFVIPTQIRGEYWWLNNNSIPVEDERITKNSKKKFYLRGKLFELQIYSQDTSLKIYKKLSKKIITESKTKRFQGRYFDLHHLEALGPFVNWRELIDYVK